MEQIEINLKDEVTLHVRSKLRHYSNIATDDLRTVLEEHSIYIYEFDIAEVRTYRQLRELLAKLDDYIKSLFKTNF